MEESENNHWKAESSLKEIWKVSFPLMISTLAFLSMIFVDRMFLSRYSLEALNASVNAGTWAWAFMNGLGMLTAISEVLVSQYNGAKRYEHIARPVWQMIWLSLFSYLIYIPLALKGGDWIFGSSLYQSLQTDYFKTLILFAPCYALTSALSGFFVGRGKTKLLIWLAIGANILNVGLDWILIFGVKGWIPEMGIKGAAIATSSGYVFEIAILFFLFLKKENRCSFQTNKSQIDKKEFSKCLRLGFPQAIFSVLEIAGLALFYQMMTSISEVHITVSGICQSVVILFSFFFDGLSKGVAAIAGNFIGAGKLEKVRKVLKSGIYLQLFFCFFLLLFFFFDLKSLVFFLFPNLQAFGEKGSSVFQTLLFSLYATYFYILFEGIRWVISGILTAAGDVYFLLIAGTLSVWLLLLAPVYFFVVKSGLGVEVAWSIMAFYSILSCLFYWARLKRGNWKQKDLLQE